MSTSFKALLLKARHQVYTLLSGHNLSKLRGEGYDFAELREYQVGDDIRKINWTITAKLGKPYIKELHTNRELSVCIAAILDGSVYVGMHHTKQEIMAETAALLGFSAQHSNDLFSGVLYTQAQTTTTPPTKQIFEIERFCKALYEYHALHTKVDLQASIDDLFNRLTKPSLLFILHDFLEPVDLSLLAQRHEVIALIIRDRNEEQMHHKGWVYLQDPRSDLQQESYIGRKSHTRYLGKRQAHDASLMAHFSRYDIRYVKLFTDEPPIEKLMTLFR